jgi:toxin-antitoxin system PIN domain toxin
MILVDISLLLSAVNTRAPMHKAARTWWENRLNSDETTGLSWLTILSFIRLTTNPKVMPEPLALVDAIAIVDGWLETPTVKLLTVKTQHWSILQNMLHAVGHGSALTMEPAPFPREVRFNPISWHSLYRSMVARRSATPTASKLWPRA